MTGHVRSRRLAGGLERPSRPTYTGLRGPIRDAAGPTGWVGSAVWLGIGLMREGTQQV